ncbi:X-ray repair cross-complementing protein 5 isoform X2 [Periplaneta americana]|uniref:X-ray repair cross-complementing protein 5 isoform X2 n=1 Tax=Periplaneta americana TaxID=6978 RepID=UPI0037E7EB7D
MTVHMHKEAIGIVIDIGHSVSQHTEDNKPGFLENAKNCVSMILKRKIFVNAKDEIALFLLGSKETDNSLDYKNIKTVHENLVIPDWDMVAFVEKLEGTNVNADWLNGVIVAMDYLRSETQGKKFSERKLVLLSDLNSVVSEDQVETIIKALKSEEITLIAIGPDVNLDVKDEPMDDDDDEINGKKNGAVEGKLKNVQQKAGEALLKHILDKTGGTVCNFADAIPQLMYFQKKNVRPTPWNVVMDIGPDIKIAVSGYRKISPATLPSWKTSSALESFARVDFEKTYTRQDENMTVVERDDVIEGYAFGTTLVPFTDVDKSMLSYKSGDKCLSVLGFTKSTNVPRHLFMGKGVLYIVPQRDDECAAVALSSLIQAMQDLGQVAIARKVYRANTGPVLGALFPRITNHYQCLVFIELPYSEDMREFIFPPVATEKSKPAKEQLDAIDALIDNMDLTSVTNEYEEDTEAFNPKKMLNPYHQHVYYSLAHRAMNPDSELPPVNDRVLDILKSPCENSPSYKLALEEIKKQFQLVEVKPKKKEVADAIKSEVKKEPEDASNNVNIEDVKLEDLGLASIVEVGSLTPEQDFKALLDQGQQFDKVCDQMQKVILNLVLRSFGTDNFVKAETALRTLRISCTEKDPSVYNDWIVQFKESLFQRGKDAFWDIVIKEQLGLITSHESTKSSVTEEDAKTFVEHVESTNKEDENNDEDMDVDDLLNQM